MGNQLRVLFSELIKTLKRPERLSTLIKTKNRMTYIKSRLRIGEVWKSYDPQRTFKKRKYHTYEDYITHQKTKLELVDLGGNDTKYREILRKRLKNSRLLRPGTTILCLAARLGTEVKAFMDVGCFAIGIDLNPGKDNPFVVYGDFHDIQFPSGCTDVVFTNSLDHVFDIKRLIAEVGRVLRPNGIFILEAGKGDDEERLPGFFESFWWSEIDDLVSAIEAFNFRLNSRSFFEYPWPGEQLWFEKES